MSTTDYAKLYSGYLLALLHYRNFHRETPLFRTILNNEFTHAFPNTSLPEHLQHSYYMNSDIAQPTCSCMFCVDNDQHRTIQAQDDTCKEILLYHDYLRLLLSHTQQIIGIPHEERSESPTWFTNALLALEQRYILTLNRDRAPQHLRLESYMYLCCIGDFAINRCLCFMCEHSHALKILYNVMLNTAQITSRNGPHSRIIATTTTTN